MQSGRKYQTRINADLPHEMMALPISRGECGLKIKMQSSRHVTLTAWANELPILHADNFEILYGNQKNIVGR